MAEKGDKLSCLCEEVNSASNLIKDNDLHLDVRFLPLLPLLDRLSAAAVLVSGRLIDG